MPEIREITLSWIQEFVLAGKYYWSNHADQERQAENISLTQTEQAILQGRILEHYHDTGRGLSCLIAGFSNEGIPIHVVCGIRSGWPVIITTYTPKPPKFKSPYERG